MKNKDFISNIVTVRDRQAQYPSSELERLRRVSENIDALTNMDKQLICYFPVSLIALLEVCFRKAMAEFADRGSDYTDRAVAMVKEVPRESLLEAILAIRDKTVSIGEVIAHTLPFSGLPHLIGPIEQLTGTNLRRYLEEGPHQKDFKFYDEPKGAIADSQKIFRPIARAFEVRHIICHEASDRLELSADQIREMIEASQLLVGALENLKKDTIYKDSPWTQVAMTELAANEAAAAEKKQNDLCNLLIEQFHQYGHKETSSKLLEKFQTAQDLWMKFVEADSELQIVQFEGGTICGSIYFAHKAALIEERVSTLQRLQNYFANELD